MTDRQWEAIEHSLAGLSADQKREVAVRILESIRGEGPAPDSDADTDRARRQREALDRLCRAVDALPVTEHEDGLTNRDHDRLIYAR
jgi:hypothetical protein